MECIDTIDCMECIDAVSYTHLDVYKRQTTNRTGISYIATKTELSVGKVLYLYPAEIL